MVNVGVPADVAAGGAHTCARSAGCFTLCWGANDNGQLGFCAPADRLVVGGILATTQVAAGANHSCALTASGEAYCWGLNLSGQLGDGTSTTRRAPVRFTRLARPVTAPSAGVSHTCAAPDGHFAQY